ncbi:MAG TPA: AraC family transcriptional regulator, partial [Devosia sp.]|nr:AraC family transcriptional regulator [Devosia sp.]
SAAQPVRVQHLPVQLEVSPHDHTYHEICLVLSGKATHLTATGYVPLGPGAVFVVPPGEVHAMLDPQDLEVVNVYYLSEWLLLDLGVLWTEPGVVPLFLSNALMRLSTVQVEQLMVSPPVLAALINELRQIGWDEEGPSPSPLFVRSCFLKCAVLIAQNWVEQNPTAGVLPFRKEVWLGMEMIERAVHAGGGYSVAESAEVAELSTDYFANIFRQSTGFSPTEYFQRRRVHRACQLLLDPAPTITSVAADLGYSDAPHFCRFFKRYRGVSPKQYRQIYGVR